MTATETERFHVLDSFRGLCACLVALSHFHANSIISGSPVLDNGSVYVDFFFVLSGFVIFANYDRRLQSGFGIGKFMLLRFGRIYPLHLFMLLAFIGVDLLQMALPLGGAMYKPFSAPGEGVYDIAANILLIHSLNVSDVLAFNGPSWSISVEFYTYLAFALILVYTARRSSSVIVFITLVSAFNVFILFGELYAKLDFGILRCFYGFGCGALLWRLRERYKAKISLYLNTQRSSIAEYSVMILAIIYIWFFGTGAGSIFAPIIFSAVILFFSYERGRLSDFLKAKTFLILGALSYSIYMVHLFIAGKFFEMPLRQLEARGILDLNAGTAAQPVFGNTVMEGTSLELVYLGVVIAASALTYNFVEKPCRSWSKRLAARIK